jgi:hypothetical protein
VVELRPHQRKAVNELKNGSILYAAVGTGKTLTALSYYVEKEAPKDVYVITTAKKRDSLDWELDAARLGIGRTMDSSPVGGVIKVDSWNNIQRYVGVQGAFFIFDEQRLVGSGSWVRSFLKIAKENHWILLSATPGDTWLDYIPVFLANGFYKNRTEFLHEHVVYNRFSKFPKVDRYLGVNKLVKQRNSIFVSMPLERHTTRVTEKILVDYDTDLFERVLKDRWHVYENRPLRDVAELFSVMRKVVNSDSSRIQKIRTLMDAHPKLIIFYNFNYELEALRTLAESASSHPTTTSAKAGTNGIDSSTKESTPNVPILTPVITESSANTISTASTDSASAATQPSTPAGSPNGTGNTTSTTSVGSEPDLAVAEEESWNGGKATELQTDDNDSSTKKKQSTSSVADQPIPGTTTSEATGGSGLKFAVAEWNGHKHEPIPTTDRWVYLVQYQAGAEGWNCIDTDAMVFFSLTYSYKLWEQAHGRIDRLNTPFSTLYYYVLLSNSVIDRAVWRALTEKRSFNEKKFLTTHSQKKV